MTCEHHEFDAAAKVTRLTDGDGGPLTGFALEVNIMCSQCGEPFVFRGPLGLSPKQPTVSMDGYTLHAPIAPDSLPSFGEDGVGMTIQIISKNPGVTQ